MLKTADGESPFYQAGQMASKFLGEHAPSLQTIDNVKQTATNAASNVAGTARRWGPSLLAAGGAAASAIGGLASGATQSELAQAVANGTANFKAHQAGMPLPHSFSSQPLQSGWERFTNFMSNPGNRSRALWTGAAAAASNIGGAIAGTHKGAEMPKIAADPATPSILSEYVNLIRRGLADPTYRPYVASLLGATAGGAGGVIYEATRKKDRKNYLAAGSIGAMGGGLMGGAYGALTTGNLGDQYAGSTMTPPTDVSPQMLADLAEQNPALYVKMMSQVPQEMQDQTQQLMAQRAADRAPGYLGAAMEHPMLTGTLGGGVAANTLGYVKDRREVRGLNKLQQATGKTIDLNNAAHELAVKGHRTTMARATPVMNKYTSQLAANAAARANLLATVGPPGLGGYSQAQLNKLQTLEPKLQQLAGEAHTANTRLAKTNNRAAKSQANFDISASDTARSNQQAQQHYERAKSGYEFKNSNRTPGTKFVSRSARGGLAGLAGGFGLMMLGRVEDGSTPHLSGANSPFRDSPDNPLLQTQ